MLQAYFAAKLADLGYPDQDVHYALDYQPSDGVAFFGRIDPDAAKRLADRLLCEQGRRHFSANRAVIRKAIKLGASFEILKLEVAGVDYANSMYVKCHLPQDVPLTPYQQSLVEVFVSLLREDVIATSRVLTTLGYALIAATPAEETMCRVLVRGQCVVLVKELPDPEFDPFETFGAEEGKRIAEQLACAVFRHYGLRVEIRALSGGPTLGEATIWGIVEDLRDGGERSAHIGNLRSLMRDAAIEARSTIAQRALKAA
jgi:hypothetical protein